MGLTIDSRHVKRYGQIAALLVRHGRMDLARQAGLDALLEQELDHPDAPPTASTDRVEDREGPGAGAPVPAEEAAEIRAGERPVVLQLVRLAGEHHIRPPTTLAMLGKTLMHLDEVARALDPGLDPNAVIRRHAADLMERQMISTLSPSAIFRAVLEANELVQQMPGRLNRFMELLSRNELSLKVNAVDEVRLIAGLEKIANRITLGLVIAALIIGAAMLVGVDGGPRLLGYPALSLVLFVAAALAGIILAVNIVLQDRD